MPHYQADRSAKYPLRPHLAKKKLVVRKPDGPQVWRECQGRVWFHYVSPRPRNCAKDVGRTTAVHLVHIGPKMSKANVPLVIFGHLWSSPFIIHPLVKRNSMMLGKIRLSSRSCWKLLDSSWTQAIKLT